MKLSIIAIILFWISTFSYSQTCDASGSPDPAYFDTALGNENNNYKLKVYFHLVYNEDGTNGYPRERLYNIKSKIESEFNGLGIFFDFQCEVNIIENTLLATEALSSNAPELFCNFGDEIENTDGINIFICSGEGGAFKGKVDNIPGKYLVLNGGTSGNIETQYEIIESETIIHELGHLFGLLHMHHGYKQNEFWYEGGQFPSCYDCNTNSSLADINACAEALGFENGLICGDLIADTPPSHPLAENCEYMPSGIFDDEAKTTAGPILDPTFMFYDPDITNYMSLLKSNQEQTCVRDHFTTDQISVMKNHLESHPVLAPYKTDLDYSSCNCFYDNSIYTNGNLNWSQIVAEQELAPSNTTFKTIIVEDHLVIDTDHTFENCEFSVEELKLITVAEGANVTFSNCSFDSCPNLWVGINVENNTSTVFDLVTIKNAVNGIKAVTSITDLPANLSIKNSTISESLVGLNLQGSVNITDFEGNKFFNLGTGVQHKNGLTINLASDEEPNVFSDMANGIVIEGVADFIENNLFNNVDTGISSTGCVATNIANNKFYNTGTAIDMKNGIINSVFGNIIGTQNLPVERGIQMTNVTGAMISFNECHATTVGIQGELVNAEINNNIINTNNTFDENSGAIRLTMANESVIHENDIFANGGTYGIEMIDGFTNTIRDNHDVEIGGSAWNRAAAIRLLASTDEVVKSNWTDSHSTHKGIIAQNSGANTFDCNVIQHSTEALHIIANSEQQMVSGNKFFTSSTDLQIESVIGVQDHLANEFRGGDAIALGLTFEGVQNSAFNVNGSIPFHLAANPDPSNGWFIDEPEDPYTCTEISLTHPGLPTFSNATALCEYYSSIKSLYTSNPRLYFIKVYHLLKYAKVKGSVKLPQCITADPIIGSLCGLVSMVEVSTEITKTTAVDSTNSTYLSQLSTIRSLLSQYNDISDRNNRETIKADIASEVADVKPSVALEITKDSIRLDSLAQVLVRQQCVEKLMKDWTMSYKQMLAWLSGKQLSTADCTSLANIAMQCSDEYGDGVHVARAILGQYNDVYYDQYDDCNLISPGTADPRSSRSDNHDITIAPNPSNGTLILDFGSKQSGIIKVYSSAGRLLIAKRYANLKKEAITIEDYSGLVFIEVRHDDQMPIVKKALILK